MIAAAASYSCIQWSSYYQAKNSKLGDVALALISIAYFSSVCKFLKILFYVTHLIEDEHSIMETLIFQVAPVVVVAIVNVKVEAVADRPCSRYTIKKKV